MPPLYETINADALDELFANSLGWTHEKYGTELALPIVSVKWSFSVTVASLSRRTLMRPLATGNGGN